MPPEGRLSGVESGHTGDVARTAAYSHTQTYGRGLLVRVPFALAPAVQPIGVLGRGARQVPGHNLGCQPQGQNQKTQAIQIHHARDCTRKCAARQDETRQHFQDAFLDGSSFPPIASREYRRGPEIDTLCAEERTKSEVVHSASSGSPLNGRRISSFPALHASVLS